MKSSIYLLQFCFISIILFSCKKSYHPHLSFYHWSISETGESYHAKHNDSVLYQFQSKKLYIKIMDIDWDENYGVYPSTHYFLDDYLYYSNHKLSDSFHIVPVIFITNRALEKTDTGAIKDLAQKIVLKAKFLVQGQRRYDSSNVKTIIDSSIRYNELQFDCDWTASTQKKYFLLLSYIKEQAADKMITSTLRLHQYKYPSRTGIPPVDELTLMCYNTGDIKNPDEVNSIFNYQKAKEYFTGNSAYPKKLNFALPAFDWTIIFKNNRFYKIDNAITEEFFADTNTTRIKLNNQYIMLKDTVLNNVFLRKGDILKRETISNEDLIKAAKLCSKARNSPDFDVIIYDIAHVNSNNYEAVKTALDCFNN